MSLFYQHPVLSVATLLLTSILIASMALIIFLVIKNKRNNATIALYGDFINTTLTNNDNLKEGISSLTTDALKLKDLLEQYEEENQSVNSNESLDIAHRPPLQRSASMMDRSLLSGVIMRAKRQISIAPSEPVSPLDDDVLVIRRQDIDRLSDCFLSDPRSTLENARAPVDIQSALRESLSRNPMFKAAKDRL
jgi:hypothetical protein